MTSPLASSQSIALPQLDEITKLHGKIADFLSPTPLVKFPTDRDDRTIYLKLETFTPIGAFKIRPALGALLRRGPDSLKNGIATVSSGNMAYGMAWAARELDIPMVAYMTQSAPQTKIDGVRQMGGDVKFISPDLWWSYISGASVPQIEETFINPVTDPGVLTGNGTLGLEIQHQLSGIDSIWGPIGGGSLITGLASSFAALDRKPDIFAVESDHAAPATAALEAGKVCEIPTRPSFIKSMGGPSVVPKLWPLTRQILSGTAVMSEQEIVNSIQDLYHKTKIVADGAGGASLAAAQVDPRAQGNVVCIISGGNIDAEDYIQILNGKVPIPK
jgi:threonine dehydratase